MSSVEAIPKGDKKESKKEEVRHVPLSNFLQKDSRPIYHFNQTEQIEEMSISLVEKLKESIDKEKYDLIIGDDSSGRIPTLLLWNIMKDRIKQKHPEWSPEEKRSAIKARFIAGGRARGNSEALLDFFGKLSIGGVRRALFVTEYIETGESIRRLAEIIEASGINFDVASLAVRPLALARLMGEFGNRHKLFIGSGSDVPAVYSNESLSGVTKIPIGKEYSVTQKTVYSKSHATLYFPTESAFESKNNLGLMRKDISLLSENIIKKVWEK